MASSPRDISGNQTTDSNLCSYLLEFSEAISSTSDLTVLFEKASTIVKTVTGLERAMAVELAVNGQVCLISNVDGSVRYCDYNQMAQIQSTSVMDLVIRGLVKISPEDKEIHALVSKMLDSPDICSGISVMIPGIKRPWGVFLFCSTGKIKLSEAHRNFIRVIVNMFGSVFDKFIARREQELEIRSALKAKKEWESTLDALREIICVLDHRGRIIRTNRATEEWGLCKVADARGKTAHELLHPYCTDENCELGQFIRSLEDNGHTVVERFIDDKALQKNLRLVFKNNPGPVTGAGGERGGFNVLIIENASFRKDVRIAMSHRINDLEDELSVLRSRLISENDKLMQELEQVLSLAITDGVDSFPSLNNIVLEANVVAAYIVRNGKVIYCNNRLAELLGLDKAAVIGREFDSLFDTGDDASPAVWESGVVHPTRNARKFVRSVRRQDHASLWLECEIVDIPIRGELIGIGSALDITVQRMLTMNIRHSEQNLHSLSKQLMYAQEDERRRIATELHDSIGQHLSAVKMNIEAGIRMLQGRDLEKEVEFLALSVANIRHAIDEVRAIAMDLRPSILDDLGLLVTIEWFCRRYRETYRNMKIEFKQAIAEHAIPKVLKILIYRVIQEAMNNIGKHANADSITISLKRMEAGIKLLIEDNGNGFDLDHQRNVGNAGLGLKSMRERAESLGGSFWIDSRPGKGTLIELSWPDQDY